MVRRIAIPLTVLALLVATQWLSAAWLPFQLDKPKHTNKVDPYNPDNLSGGGNPGGGTPVPTATPCPGCNPQVVFSYPNTQNQVVQVPYQPLFPAGSDGTISLIFTFDQDMDLTSSQNGIQVAPVASYIYEWQGPRQVSVLFNTVADWFVGNTVPARFNQAYTVTLTSQFKATGGLPLVPFSLAITTGPFKALAFKGLWSNSPSMSLYCNGPIDLGQDQATKIQNSGGWVLNRTTSYSPSNNVSFSLSPCISANTSYTLTALAGIRSAYGDTSSNTVNATLVAETPKIVSVYVPHSSTDSLQIGYNYAMNHLVSAQAVTITPQTFSGFIESWNTSGCSEYFVKGGFVSGVTYTVTVGTTAQSSTGVAVSSARTATFVMP